MALKKWKMFFFGFGTFFKTDHSHGDQTSFRIHLSFHWFNNLSIYRLMLFISIFHFFVHFCSSLYPSSCLFTSCCACLSIFQFPQAYLSARYSLSFVHCPFVTLSICPFIHLSLYPFVPWSICLFVHLSNYPHFSIYHSLAHLYLCPLVHLSFFHLSLCISMCLITSLAVCACENVSVSSAIFLKRKKGFFLCLGNVMELIQFSL